MTTTLALAASFGSGKAGLNTVGYTVLHLDETIAQARTTTGVVEAGGGIYKIAAVIPDGVTAGYIVADTGETVPRPWVAGFNPNDLLSKADIPPVFVAGASSALAVPGPLCTPTKPFPIKRGDTLEPLTIRLYNADRTPLQLPEGTTAVFNLRSSSTGQVVLSRVSAVVTSGDGDTEPATLTHLWATGETDVADDYEAEFEALLPGGGVQTYPANGYLRVTVFDDIA